MSLDKLNLFASIICVLDREIPHLSENVSNLYKYLDRHFEHYEILLINCPELIKNREQIETLLTKIPYIRYIQLTSYTYEDAPIISGIENSIGDYIVIFSMHTDPETLIRESIEKLLSGHQMVVGVSISHRSLIYRMMRKIFRLFLNRLFEYQIPENSTSFRVFTRTVANLFLNSRELNGNLFIQINRFSQNSVQIKYQPKSLKLLMQRHLFPIVVSRFLKMMIYNTKRPMRIVTLLGILGSLFTIITVLYTIIINLIKNKVVEGWTTTNLFLSIQFLLVFIILIFIGEYLNTLLIERKFNHSSMIAFEKHSLVQSRDGHLNVVDQSHFLSKENIKGDSSES